MTRILVADDHRLFREGLKRLLDGESDLSIEGEADSGAQALSLLANGGWNLMLLDLRLPDMEGMDVLEQMRERNDTTPVLILSMYPAEQYAARTARLGALGYMSKNCSSGELIQAIRKVAQGDAWLEARSARNMLMELARGAPTHAHQRLSPREFSVFMNLARGRSIASIAAEMQINAKTVSTYRARVLDKLTLENNAAIVRYALDHDLL